MYLPQPSAGGDFVLPPVGAHPAIAYRIVDLGTQRTEFNGEAKTQHKIMLSWELHGEGTQTEDGRPMSIHQRYTWSMHEKATLRKHLESWRGAKFKETDFGEGGFDIRKLLGAKCLLTVMHDDGKDRTYANVVSITRLPKEMQVQRQHNESMFLWLEPVLFDQDAFDALSEGLQNVIKKSPEYHEAIKRGSGAELMAAAGTDDDSIPF